MSQKETAVAVKDVRKEFILPQNKNSTFKQTIVNIVKKGGKVTQKTLDGVSFNVRRGDFFGIVGRNGSGKSTLLKLIAGVYSPTSGGIEVHGGLTPFIELGVGFNPELSGRDNVYLNGALLGFTRQQISKIYDEIVAFAELGPFMDQKLKNYSSGMQVRLAFSIAIKAKNDVLIFDEVLAVGDEAFQRKCLDVFERYKAEGQTVILVTHDMEQVRRFCTKAILIHEGKVRKIGNPKTVADDYSKLNQQQISQEMERKNKTIEDSKTGIAAHLKVEGDAAAYKSGNPIEVSVRWNQGHSIERVVVSLYKNTGEYIVGLSVPDEDIKMGEATLHLQPRLGVGKYYFTIEAYNKNGGLSDDIYQVSEFIVSDAGFRDMGSWSGLLALEHHWGKKK